MYNCSQLLVRTCLATESNLVSHDDLVLLCRKDKGETAVVQLVVAVARVTGTKGHRSTWKVTTRIGKISTPGYSLLSIEMQPELSVVYCVNSVSATKECRGAVLEPGLLSPVQFFKNT